MRRRSILPLLLAPPLFLPSPPPIGALRSLAEPLRPWTCSGVIPLQVVVPLEGIYNTEITRCRGYEWLWLVSCGVSRGGDGGGEQRHIGGQQHMCSTQRQRLHGHDGQATTRSRGRWCQVLKLGFDEKFIRIWEFYLVYSASGLKS
ncbi:hypothetical protein CFC21_098232 [Triticum aestivum]|uniref:Uncharacterized protein n=4 Tax=Triticum TaxID=4564 RepID=A0A9R0ZFY7_TRITD|nr:hypothetical protein TRIUR3_15160 [Triticum urartu]KAF7096257.1 hypothetical protein CFC21_098232 [Triticum aestivum]VAI76339.1 unnamed protein product [Triticum turgidum subsp. durum]